SLLLMGRYENPLANESSRSYLDRYSENSPPEPEMFQASPRWTGGVSHEIAPPDRQDFLDPVRWRHLSRLLRGATPGDDCRGPDDRRHLAGSSFRRAERHRTIHCGGFGCIGKPEHVRDLAGPGV